MTLVTFAALVVLTLVWLADLLVLAQAWDESRPEGAADGVPPEGEALT